jgi:hypothetical protein
MSEKPDALLVTTTPLEWIPLGDMRIPAYAQRGQNDRFVASIAANFDPNRFGFPVVSQRGEVYNLLDGQQRCAGYRVYLGAGWESQRVQCRVYRGLTDAEEAGLFLDLQIQLTVSAYDKYDKAVNAGREPEASIAQIVEACGLRVTRGRMPGGICAVNALRKVYVSGNGQLLAETLRILSEAFGDPGLEGDLIRGVGLLCGRYNGTLDYERSVQALSGARGGVKGLTNAAEKCRAKMGCSKSVAIAASAVDIINGGGRGKKLSPWWRTEQ